MPVMLLGSLGIHLPWGFLTIVYLYVQATWFGFAAAPVPYIDAGGFHGGKSGALVVKKNFQVGVDHGFQCCIIRLPLTSSLMWLLV